MAQITTVADNSRTADRGSSMNATKFVRIDRAYCKKCGDKRALRVQQGLRVIERDLPVTLDADVVERTPWRCICAKQVELDVVIVE